MGDTRFVQMKSAVRLLLSKEDRRLLISAIAQVEAEETQDPDHTVGSHPPAYYRWNQVLAAIDAAEK